MVFVYKSNVLYNILSLQKPFIIIITVQEIPTHVTFFFFSFFLKEGKKKFDKETEKYYTVLEKHLSLSSRKKEPLLQEVTWMFIYWYKISRTHRIYHYLRMISFTFTECFDYTL